MAACVRSLLATTDFPLLLGLASFRRLRQLDRAWQVACDTRPAKICQKKMVLRLREITCGVSHRVYWSIVNAALEGATFGCSKALFWAVRFDASAVTPTLSVGDHICILAYLNSRHAMGG